MYSASVVMCEPWVVGKIFRSIAFHFSTQLLFNTATWLIVFSWWYKFIVNNLSDIRKVINILIFYFDWPNRYSNGESSDFHWEFCCFVSEPYKDSCFINCDYLTQNVALPFQQICAQFIRPLYLFFNELFWNHFGTHLVDVLS